MAPALIIENVVDHPIKPGAKKSSTNIVDVHSLLHDAEARFTKRNATSAKLHEEALESLPGGNTRSMLHTAPFPVYMKSGKGYQVTSEDGHTYTDFVGELTAGLYGHSHPTILSTLNTTIHTTGLNLGATTQAESRYAALLCSRFAIDRVRFCNSGTEANLHALSAARKYTDRRKVVAFEGGYHGAVLSFPQGVAANNVDRGEWLIASYNDADSVRQVVQDHGQEIAAVILEPMQGAGGAIPASRTFLHACQDAAHSVGALFIVDEVMTSRLAPGGLSSMMDVQPDLKTFGKYLGGGLAFGAFGGKEEIMAVFDPRREGALSHSGTFNNNTLAMTTGHAGLSQVYTPDVCKEFTRLGDEWRGKLNEVCRGTRMCFTGVGTIMAVHSARKGELEEETVVRKDSEDEDWEFKDLFWYEMMEEGFWITRRGSFALILDTPQSEMDRFVDVVKGWLEKHQRLLEA